MASKTSFNLGFILPNQLSNQSLSHGIYSLSSRSNIPFAKLVGKGIDKIFTWGETVEVPPGQLCRVVNASYHAGDLFINSGCDLNNRPAAITVPVPFSQALLGATNYWVPKFPADVRSARRAYCNVAATAGDTLPITGFVVGTRLDGSHNTFDQIAGNLFGFTGSGYISAFSFAPSTTFGQVPLGQGGIPGDDSRPHSLLTTAAFYFPVLNVTVNTTPNVYYTMEY